MALYFGAMTSKTDEEEYILEAIEDLEDELDLLPYRSIIQRYRKRSSIQRWRKALALLRGESVAERRASILGRFFGGLLK